MGSPASGWARTPLMTRRWLVRPSSASSAPARAASASAARSGRATSTSVVDGRIGEHRDGTLVDGPLALQPGERAEAGGLFRVGRQVVRPCGRQRQEPQRVPGRRGVEHDVVVALGGGGVGQQPGERVEGGDLDGARTGQLLVDRGELRRRQVAR